MAMSHKRGDACEQPEDLKGQLDAQSRETEKFKLLLQEKKDQLSQLIAPLNLQSELEVAKADNLRLTAELDELDENRLLNQDNTNLSQENANFTSKLDEFNAAIAQLRGELNSVKADVEKAIEKSRKLEAERAIEKQKLRVFEEKAETRARISDELKSELEETVAANDRLQTELSSVNMVLITLLDMKSELEEKLKKTEADLNEALNDIVAAKARSSLLAEYEWWKFGRMTLEHIERGMENIPARILDVRMIEDKAKKDLEASSEDHSEETVFENSDSSHTE
ncbi:uncharacterized protein LOC132607934 [Lycium barbarum]|uniref:uncharacterized protein LOC132607934 n=1 Tax=Lycium barbarum TaxID=112863 RepID=UPI00293F72A2|nr:uncharacterized protein LOC132607934 [Lycium barbarum]